METKKLSKKKLSKKTVDTILEVEAAAKRLLKEAILKKQIQILQEEFLLELDQWPTDEEMDEIDETSNEDSTEPLDSMDEISDEETDLE